MTSELGDCPHSYVVESEVQKSKVVAPRSFCQIEKPTCRQFRAHALATMGTVAPWGGGVPTPGGSDMKVQAQTHKFFFSISLNMPSVLVPWFPFAHWPAVPSHSIGALGST